MPVDQLALRKNAGPWELDAEGGLLSYTKMEHVRKQKQVRKRTRVENKNGQKRITYEHEEFESHKYPLCSTKTGSFPCLCCCRSRKSDFADELGLGISLYFKQLKFFIMMMFVCTLLSLPAYLFYWSVNKSESSLIYEDPKSFFSTFTLGNLG